MLYSALLKGSDMPSCQLRLFSEHWSDSVLIPFDH